MRADDLLEQVDSARTASAKGTEHKTGRPSSSDLLAGCDILLELGD